MFGSAIRMELARFIRFITPPSHGNSSAEIARFEKTIGQLLPEDYREFLTMTDGGFLPSDPYPSAVVSRDLRIQVGEVIGLREGHGLSQYWYREHLGDPLPDDLIPIMGDGSGNLICLGVAEGSYGRVYFKELGDIDCVSESFLEFVEDLFAWTEHPKYLP